MDNKKYTAKTAALKAIEGSFDTLFLGDKGDIITYIESKKATDEVIDYYDDGSYWYRLYKSGWIEQGGKFTPTSTGSVTVTLPKLMKTSTYYVHANYMASSSNMYGQCFTLTNYSFVVKTYAQNPICWEVKGFVLS
jgi:hypothetical protein